MRPTPGSPWLVLGMRFRCLFPPEALRVGCWQNSESLGFRESRAVRLWTQPQWLLERHPVSRHTDVSAGKHKHVHAALDDRAQKSCPCGLSCRPWLQTGEANWIS